MKLAAIALVAPLVASLAACAIPVETFVAIAPPRAPSRSVDVVLDARNAKPFTELGVVAIELVNVDGTALPGLYERLHDDAASHGCDVIIPNPLQRTHTGWFLTATCGTYAPAAPAAP